MNGAKWWVNLLMCVKSNLKFCSVLQSKHFKSAFFFLSSIFLLAYLICQIKGIRATCTSPFLQYQVLEIYLVLHSFSLISLGEEKTLHGGNGQSWLC